VFDEQVLIITGPTASGKSHAALEMALRIGGEIINGDSMQLYEHLPILTACPTEKECLLVPHHLYQVLGSDQIGSAGWWVQEAEEKIRQVLERGNIPIIVGGTGLYLQALTQGLSPVPEIPPEIRRWAREQATQYGVEGHFHDYVCGKDPQVRDHLNPSDVQRLTRALEVIVSTGRSVFEWQKVPRVPSSFTFRKQIMMPPRDELYRRINNRFIHMIEEGAIGEVQSLLEQPVRLGNPILRAVGVKEIAAYLKGNITKDQMIDLGQQSTRQYAKRQLTWLRTQVEHYIPVVWKF
jgi:tRNA dimethylallyltransferase